jgi:hypothetical protein
MKPAPSLKTPCDVGYSLGILKALGDSLVCIGKAGPAVALLDDTVANLGHLIIDLVDRVGVSLEVL